LGYLLLVCYLKTHISFAAVQSGLLSSGLFVASSAREPKEGGYSVLEVSVLGQLSSIAVTDKTLSYQTIPGLQKPFLASCHQMVLQCWTSAASVRY